MMIRGYDIAAVLKTTWKEIGEDKISVYAGQMAYAGFFSLFPLVLFFAALLSLVGDASTVQGWFNSRLATALPGDVAALLGSTIQKVVFAKGAPGLLSFGLLTAAWAGSGVFGALRGALNDAYDVEETRPLWKQYALQLLMLGLTGIVLLAATVVLLNGEGVMGWIGNRLGLSQVTKLIWTVIQFPLAIASLVGVLWLTYYLLPNCRDQDNKTLLLCASLATALWIAATLVFRLYVQKFNALNPAYGAIGAIMLLLTWLYYSAFVLLAVGELNAVLEGKGAKAAADTAPTRAGVPREHALVPLGAVASARHPEPRWAARMRAHAQTEGRASRRGLRRFALFRVADNLERTIVFVRDWVEGTLAYLRADFATAQREVGGILRSIGIGTVIVATATVIALLGTLSLVTGVILLVGDQWLPSDLFWLAALLVALMAGGIAVWLARRGGALVRAGLATRDAGSGTRDAGREGRAERLIQRL